MAISRARPLTFPAVDETFRLTMRERVSWLDVVRSVGYNSSIGWRFSGIDEIPAGTSKEFKLIQIEPQENFLKVVESLGGNRQIPDGIWLLSFVESFLPNNKDKAVGLADGSWENPEGHCVFPKIYTSGSLGFHRTNTRFLEDSWLWLVFAS